MHCLKTLVFETKDKGLNLWLSGINSDQGSDINKEMSASYQALCLFRENTTFF